MRLGAISRLVQYINFLNAGYMRADDFDNFILNRATRLLNEIEKAMGKTISGRDSEEVLRAFGRAI